MGEEADLSELNKLNIIDTTDNLSSCHVEEKDDNNEKEEEEEEEEEDEPISAQGKKKHVNIYLYFVYDCFFPNVE